MATSFAAYASQYLNRNVQAESALSSSQPMFFSFTTDDESRVGHDTDLDDFDDPHIRESEVGSAAQYHNDEDENPYLRLDEDEDTGFTSQRRRFIRPNDTYSASSSRHGGWLAHLAASHFRWSRSRSPSQSSASSDSGPPPDMFAQAGVQRLPPPPLATRKTASLSLTESLLPRDGLTRPIDVFNLPDPRHTPRSRRKYNDSTWTALWLTGVSLCVFFSILLLFLPYNHRYLNKHLPYTTLLHTVPLLTILTVLSAVVAYVHIFLLRIFVKPVMIGTSVFVPATLFISAVWAFAGSFMWDTAAEEPPTWGETVGLRIFALIPLALSIITARRLIYLPRDIHVTSSTLTLTTHLLIANPFLLALSPAILLVSLIGSVPFLTLVFRLLLYGYAGQILSGSSRIEGHLHAWANWAIIGVVIIWLWSWGVARGILRMSCASVIGAWYFANQDAMPPSPMSTHTIHAAVVRSTGSSLGTICLSASILTIIRGLTLIAIFLGRLPAYIPPRAFFLINGIRLAVGYLDGVTMALSKYALVYSGLTGDAFMPSARRAKALTTSVEAKVTQSRKKYSAEGSHAAPLTLLTVAPLTLSFPFALLTYLFVTHTLGSPDSALGASVLAGTVTALVGLFCVGLVKDAADTLYLCYCIDKDIGEMKREEVFIVFDAEVWNKTSSRVRQSGCSAQALSSQPEEILPLSPQSPPHMTTQLPSQRQHRETSWPIIERAPKQQSLSSKPVSPPLSPSAPSIRQHSTPSSQPGPPPPMLADAEDLDPFKLSYVEEPGQVASITKSSSPTLSLQLELQPESNQLYTVPCQEQEVQSQIRRKSSAELNMKSKVWSHHDESSDEEEVGLYKKYMADSFTKETRSKSKETGGESHERSSRRSNSLREEQVFGVASGDKSGSERGQASSQFFPGSGFF